MTQGEMLTVTHVEVRRRDKITWGGRSICWMQRAMQKTQREVPTPKVLLQWTKYFIVF